MAKRESGNRKVNRRYRRAAERIWGNSSLRDELDDEQAKRVLDWGSARLKKAASETADLPDEEAGQLIETQTEQVSGVIRQVNDLAGAMTGGDQQQIAERVEALKASLEAMQSQEEAEETPRPKALPDNWAPPPAPAPAGDSAQIFNQLMSLLDGEEE